MSDNPNVYQGQLGYGRPNDVQLSADGSKIYATGVSGNFTVYSAVNGSVLQVWGFDDELGAVDISPDGTFAMIVHKTPIAETFDPVSGQSTYTATVYKVDLVSGQVQRFDHSAPTTGYAMDYTFDDIAILSDGTVLLGQNYNLMLLDPATGQFSAAGSLEADSPVFTSSTDGRYVFIAQTNRSYAPVAMYETGQGITATNGDNANGVMGRNRGAIAITEDASLVAQAHQDGLVIYSSDLQLRVDLGQLHPELIEGGVLDVAFSAAGDRLYVLNSGDRVIFEVSTADWSLVAEYPTNVDLSYYRFGLGNALLVAPDASYFTVLGDDALMVIDPTAPVDASGGNDILAGGDGADVIDGLGGNDKIEGRAGEDALSGSDGEDILVGGSGADTLDGGAGNDELYSGEWVTPFDFRNPSVPPGFDYETDADFLLGGPGYDLFYAGFGDNIDGGDDYDFANLTFRAAPSGIQFDTNLTTQVVGGATITNIEVFDVIEGSDFDDTIIATGEAGRGTVYGAGGNDVVVAGLYADNVFGGDGNDDLSTVVFSYANVYGGAGNDIIRAGNFVDGGDGDDIIYANDCSLYLKVGGAGDDAMYGWSGNDELVGGTGADSLAGAAGDDFLYADEMTGILGAPSDDLGLEHDVVDGGEGDDFISAGAGDDIDGGAGSDRLQLSLAGATAGVSLDANVLMSGQPITVAGGTIQNIEILDRLRASEYDDTLVIGPQPISIGLFAGSGDDSVTVNAANGYFYGNAGNDSFIVTSGGDSYFFGDEGDDLLISGAGADNFIGGSGSDTIDYRNAATGQTLSLMTGMTDGDSFYDVENINGSTFDDIVTGNSDLNQLAGGAGNDTLDGDAGDDRLIGGEGSDSFLFSRYGGADTIVDFAAGETLRIKGYTSATSITQNGSDVVIILSDGDQVTLLDTTVATVQAGLRFDSAQPLKLVGTEGNDTLTGGSGNDNLSGLGGNDSLRGGLGADTMNGGAGNDSFAVDNAGDLVIEGRRGGDDIVYASVDYVLRSGVQVEMLYASFDPYAGATAKPWPNFSLTGNEIGQGIQGGFAHDLLSGMGGADRLFGLYGNDTLDGGTGNDTLYGGQDLDTFVYRANGGKDVIYDFAAGESINVYDFAAAQSVVQSGANVVVTLARGQQITVNYATLADVNAALHFMSGGSGGGGGGSGGGAINGTADNDTLSGTSGDDVINGLAGRDSIRGNAGNDIISGGLGNDQLSGGSGADRFVYTELQSGSDRISDFVSGTDKIDLDAFGITAANVTKTVSNGNLVLGVDANRNGSSDFTITLVGVTTIGAGDLIF